MTFYVKQKFFSWNDRSSVYDSNGNEVFYVGGEGFSFGKKLHIYDALNNEVAFIKQKIFSFLPKYHVYCGENQIAEITREFTFFKPKYTVDGLDWLVKGDFFDHEYEITSGGVTVATVSKEWFTLGDAYEININDSFDTVSALAVVLIINACIDEQNN